MLNCNDLPLLRKRFVITVRVEDNKMSDMSKSPYEELSMCIVDDDVDLLNELREDAEDLGFRELHVFSSRSEAKEFIKKGIPVDIYIIDRNIAGDGNGLTLVEFMRSQEHVVDSEIILFSGAVSEERIARYSFLREHNIARVEYKPIRLRSLGLENYASRKRKVMALHIPTSPAPASLDPESTESLIGAQGLDAQQTNLCIIRAKKRSLKNLSTATWSFLEIDILMALENLDRTVQKDSRDCRAEGLSAAISEREVKEGTLPRFSHQGTTGRSR
jgi:CheY-like chemotaxis protein